MVQLIACTGLLAPGSQRNGKWTPTFDRKMMTLPRKRREEGGNILCEEREAREGKTTQELEGQQGVTTRESTQMTYSKHVRPESRPRGLNGFEGTKIIWNRGMLDIRRQKGTCKLFVVSSFFFLPSSFRFFSSFFFLLSTPTPHPPLTHSFHSPLSGAPFPSGITIL